MPTKIFDYLDINLGFYMCLGAVLFSALLLFGVFFLCQCLPLIKNKKAQLRLLDFTDKRLGQILIPICLFIYASISLTYENMSYNTTLTNGSEAIFEVVLIEKNDMEERFANCEALTIKSHCETLDLHTLRLEGRGMLIINDELTMGEIFNASIKLLNQRNPITK